MARMTIMAGLCPICGETARRTISTHHGIARESYHCLEHGRREASPTGWTVQQWGAPAGPTMSMLADMLEFRSVPSWAR